MVIACCRKHKYSRGLMSSETPQTVAPIVSAPKKLASAIQSYVSSLFLFFLTVFATLYDCSAKANTSEKLPLTNFTQAVQWAYKNPDSPAGKQIIYELNGPIWTAATKGGQILASAIQKTGNWAVDFINSAPDLQTKAIRIAIIIVVGHFSIKAAHKGIVKVKQDVSAWLGNQLQPVTNAAQNATKFINREYGLSGLTLFLIGNNLWKYYYVGK